MTVTGKLRAGQAVARYTTPRKNPELLQQGTLGQPLTTVGGDEAARTRIDLCENLVAPPCHMQYSTDAVESMSHYRHAQWLRTA